jgi:hypothetical protein
MNDSEIIPLINRPSDHDAQLIILNNIKNQPHEHQFSFTRKINKHITPDFQIKLSNETWGSVFNGDDVFVIFNSFLKCLFKDFYSSFPLTK